MLIVSQAGDSPRLFCRLLPLILLGLAAVAQRLRCCSITSCSEPPLPCHPRARGALQIVRGFVSKALELK